MIKLIIGPKGSGKTKKLIDLANDAALNYLGNVVCIEKTPNLVGNISRKIRLVETDEYNIKGHEMLEGFIMGFAAGNYDISDIFVDATFKIIGRDYKKLIDFFNELNKLSEKHNVNIWFTLSCNKEELPPLIFNYGENVNS